MSASDSAQAKLQQQQDGLLDLPSPEAAQASGPLSTLRAVLHAADYIYTHPLSSIGNAISVFAGLVTGNGRATTNAARRLGGWVSSGPLRALRSWITSRLDFMVSLIFAIKRELLQGIAAALRTSESYAARLVGVERRQRQHALRREHAAMLAHIRAAIQTVQRQAVSGYKLAQHDQQPVIIRLADDIAARLPIVRDLLGKIVTGAIDLAEIDDPLLRLVVSRALLDLLDQLGIEKPMGQLLQQLLGNVLDHGVPRDLTQVIADLGYRLNAVEQDWTQFMGDGGPEILQAGEGWKDITSLITDAGLLAFFGMQAVDPNGWATAISDTLGVLVADTMTAAADLIRSA